MSSSDTSSDIKMPVNRKKRKTKTKLKREVIKEARVKNIEYINYKGNIVVPKAHGIACKCRMKCSENIPMEEQEEMYGRLRSFHSKDEQDAHLQSLIEVQNVSRKRPRMNENEGKSKPKEVTYAYWLNCSGGRKKVCKNAFLQTFAISDDRIRRLRKLLCEGQSPNDRRGRSMSGNAKPISTVMAVENHIKTFPTYETPYGSEHYTYLSCRLNMKIMYDMFKSSHPDINISFSFYRKVFKDIFNYRFGQPQIDTCCTCEELSVKLKNPRLSNIAKAKISRVMLAHKQRSKKFFTKIKEVEQLVENSKEIAGLCFDFMQNLALPTTPVQETFYLRQLTVDVFNIHCLKTHKAQFYVYHEGIAKKGPNEVCSFLLNYIGTHIGPEVKHLHLFSDACGGQNKNHDIIRVLLLLVGTDRFETISHYFPVRGHSYLPCDRDFSVVKRKIRKTDRIYTIHEFVELIITSSSNLRFDVTEVSSDDILDIHTWWPQHYKKFATSYESKQSSVKEKFKLSKYNEFRYKRQNKGVVFTKYFIDGLQRETFNLMKNPNPGYPVEKAYSQPIAITAEKMKDLEKFKRFIPFEEDDNVKHFYEEVFSLPTHV